MGKDFSSDLEKIPIATMDPVINKLIVLLASASLCLADSISIPVSHSPSPSVSVPIAGNFQSFSIEFAFWADFGGTFALVYVYLCSNVVRKSIFAK